MSKKCLWCLKSGTEVSFDKKAHTIPKSLGGINFNVNVCDGCNDFFGNRNSLNNKYSIEEALKETFNITRQRLLDINSQKRKTGRFKSKFFEIKNRKENCRLSIKPTFQFSGQFQKEICRAFKRGLYKMFFEELNRQKKIGFEKKFDVIRDFARFDKGDLPIYYFIRKIGMFILREKEVATPELMFDRMTYLFTNNKFTEIEFLGHVFGFPTSAFNNTELNEYKSNSFSAKREHFKGVIEIKRLTDVDIALTIMNS